MSASVPHGAHISLEQLICIGGNVLVNTTAHHHASQAVFRCNRIAPSEQGKQNRNQDGQVYRNGEIGIDEVHGLALVAPFTRRLLPQYTTSRH